MVRLIRLLTFLWVFALGLLPGCAPSPRAVTVSIRPVSLAESRKIRAALVSGRAPESLPSNETQENSPECDSFLSTLPGDVVHGFVTVPEDRSRPSGRQIRVFYYGRTQGSDKSAAPVVFFNGGPSADSHSSYTVLEQHPQAARVPFIYIDQRGNGCSDPYPEDPTAETAERLTHYTSRNIVLDAEAVREAVFGRNSKWKAFGQSYGGLIVQRYLEVAPGSLQGAFAHGYSVMSDPAEWLKLRILSQRRVAEDYFARYPGDRQAVSLIRARLPAESCFEDGKTRVCGATVLDAMTILLGFQSSWSSMHQWLTALSAGKEIDPATLNRFVRSYVFGIYASNLFAGSIISRVEMNSGRSDGETCDQAMRELRLAGETPDTWPINECRLLPAVKNSEVDPLVEGVRSIDPLYLSVIGGTLVANPALPFFLYSGQKDVFVPVETFLEEAQALGKRVNYRNFLESGHEGFHTEQQVWDDLLMALPAELL